MTETIILQAIVWNFDHSRFEFVSIFVLRYSNFRPHQPFLFLLSPVSSKKIWDTLSFAKGGWGDFSDGYPYPPYGFDMIFKRLNCYQDFYSEFLDREGYKG